VREAIHAEIQAAQYVPRQAVKTDVQVFARDAVRRELFGEQLLRGRARRETRIGGDLDACRWAWKSWTDWWDRPSVST
jgi:hypothetical protein